MLINKKAAIDYLAYFFCVVFTVVGSIVSLNRYWQYEVSFIDFGQYDQAIWKVSRFQEPIITHFVHGKINVLGDHFTPSIFLISPLYWLTDKSEMILLVQALAVGLSGFFLYDLAKTVLKNKLLSVSILLCYFLFVGLQNAVITEFHELTVMTLPLMLTFWALIKGKIRWYFVFLLLTLGFKEITFALGVGIGIAIILLKKEWRTYGIITILISLIWGLLAFKVFIPYFSHGDYLYASSFPPGIYEKVYAMVDHPLKRHTLLFSFLSFSFLPIFAPQFWLAILQDYTTRFLPENFITRWDLGLHYNAQSAVLLAVSSIFSLKYLLRFSIIKRFKTALAILLILNAFILFRFILHGPFMLAFNPAFYRHSSDFEFLNTMVKKIPKNASVATHNNLATRFTHQEVRLLTQHYDDNRPDYILMDMREGQNPNDFLGSDNMKRIYFIVSHDNHYSLSYKTRNQFIFKKNK